MSIEKIKEIYIIDKNLAIKSAKVLGYKITGASKNSESDKRYKDKINILRSITTVYDSFKKKGIVLDKLQKKVVRFGDGELEKDIHEANEYYTKVMNKIFDAKAYIWSL